MSRLAAKSRANRCPTTRRTFSSSTTTRRSATCWGAISVEQGFRVTTAADAAAARARHARARRSTLVLLDVMMPGENGLELRARAQGDAPHPHLHADRARRTRAPHRGSRSRRRRLPPQAVRAARAAAAPAQHPAPRPGAQRAAATRSAWAPYVFHVARGELKHDEETDQADRARARSVAHVRPAHRHADAAPRAVAATIRPAASAPSTCRSTVCGARSRPIRPIPSTCRQCAAKGIFSTPTEVG